jgi:polyisoprenoid-binding protein YceI
MKKMTRFGTLLVLALAACDNKSSAPQATVATSNAAVVTQAPTGAARYTFSNEGSKVEWTGAKITGKHDGAFHKFTGSVDLPASGKVEEGRVTLEIDPSSITADQEKLVGHLKSPDFFDVAKFPKITFTSTALTAAGANGATYTVTGNLEMHGVSKSITFPAKINLAGDAVNASSEFQLNRKDFGIVYPGKPDDLIKDNVTVRLDVHAKKAI